MVTKQEKLQHRKEVHLAIAGLVILFIVFLGVQTVDNFVNFGVAVGLETINESIEMFFLDQFAQFGILVVAGYHLIPTTFWVLGITGVVVRILDLGFSPFLLVLIVAAARVVGQGLLYLLGRYSYTLVKGRKRELAEAGHILHRYKIIVFLLVPWGGPIGDVVMIIAGHQRINFMKIAPILFVGNAIRSSLWIYWTVASINFPSLFT